MTDVTMGAINFEGYVNKRVKLQYVSHVLRAKDTFTGPFLGVSSISIKVA